jgi:hypothetical protein
MSLDECRKRIEQLEQELQHTRQMLKAEETIRRILERGDEPAAAAAAAQNAPPLGKSKSATILKASGMSPLPLRRNRRGQQQPSDADVAELTRQLAAASLDRQLAVDNLHAFQSLYGQLNDRLAIVRCSIFCLLNFFQRKSILLGTPRESSIINTFR